MRWVFTLLLATILCYGVMYVVGYIYELFGGSANATWLGIAGFILYFPCAWVAAHILKSALADEE